MYLQKVISKKTGAGSGSISQRHGSADPDPDLNPHQKFMDSQHCVHSVRPFSFYKGLFCHQVPRADGGGGEGAGQDRDGDQALDPQRRGQEHRGAQPLGQDALRGNH